MGAGGFVSGPTSSGSPPPGAPPPGARVGGTEGGGRRVGLAARAGFGLGISRWRVSFLGPRTPRAPQEDLGNLPPPPLPAAVVTPFEAGGRPSTLRG